MPRLTNEKHELFAQASVNNTGSVSYLRAGYSCNPEYAKQNAYALKKNNPAIVDRINELKEMAWSDEDKELSDYIKLLDDIAFARGDFSGSNKATTKERESACTKVMKAKGIEGADNIKLSGEVGGGYQLIMHTEPMKVDEKKADDS